MKAAVAKRPKKEWARLIELANYVLASDLVLERFVSISVTRPVVTAIVDRQPIGLIVVHLEVGNYGMQGFTVPVQLPATECSALRSCLQKMDAQLDRGATVLDDYGYHVVFGGQWLRLESVKDTITVVADLASHVKEFIKDFRQRNDQHLDVGVGNSLLSFRTNPVPGKQEAVAGISLETTEARSSASSGAVLPEAASGR